jgi:nitroreductase
MDKNDDRLFDPELTNLLIRSRRSVFTDQLDSGRSIPDEIIWQLLENANWAPTHKRTEPWRFSVFCGDGRKKFADFQASSYKETAGEKFKEDKYLKLQRTPLECSHIIAIGMKRNESSGIAEIEEIAAVACAVQNIYLSVTAYGLGGYWSTGGVTYQSQAKPFFGLDDQDRLMGFFYLGYIKIPSVNGTRKPVKDKTIWISD